MSASASPADTSSRSRSPWRFEGRVLLAFIAVTLVEVLIATLWSQHRWLRGFVGDVVAIAWVYLLLKTFLRASPMALASAALTTGYLVELAQYVAKLQDWHIQNRILRVLVGSVPDAWDVLAYTLGFGLVLAVETALAYRRKT